MSPDDARLLANLRQVETKLDWIIQDLDQLLTALARIDTRLAAIERRLGTSPVPRISEG